MKGEMKMSLKEKMRPILSVVILCVMLLTPNIANAATKTLSLVMEDYSVTGKVTCPSANIQGGALAGGTGIRYVISDKEQTALFYHDLISGGCIPNTSYSHVYSPKTGYSRDLKVKLYQNDKDYPGIGWTRIDY